MKKKLLIMFTVLFLLLITFLLINYKLHDSLTNKVIISKNSISTNKNKIKISMKSQKGYKIYYTLDGSIPTSESTEYKKKIVLDSKSSPDSLVLEENKVLMIHSGINKGKNIPKATVVRAIAISPEGEEGPVETKTYFIGQNIKDYYPDTAVLSIVIDPKSLLDYKKGIMVKGYLYDEWLKQEESKEIIENNRFFKYVGNYTQKGKEWERAATVEFFDKSNKSSWKEEVGIRLKGNASKKFSQKSFNIYLRDKYGNEKLEYELFDDALDINNETLKSYKSFTLRNGGNETHLLKFKDQWLQDLVKDRHVETQSGRPVIVFINGEYWGPYNLQEKYSDTYYADHYNLNKDNIIVIKEQEVDEGKDSDIKYYNELMEYANKDMTIPEVYNSFLEKVDIESMIDYYAIEIYIGNADCVDNNEKSKNTQLWRVRDRENNDYGDGKWRWSLFDLEYSSSLHIQTETLPSYNSIEDYIEKNPLFASAMKNTSFRESFYKTLNELGEYNFESKRVEETINEYYNKWQPLMKDNDERFDQNNKTREKSKKAIIEYFKKRYDYIINY